MFVSIFVFEIFECFYNLNSESMAYYLQDGVFRKKKKKNNKYLLASRDLDSLRTIKPHIYIFTETPINVFPFLFSGPVNEILEFSLIFLLHFSDSI